MDYVIIGNSAAAIGAVEGIRKVDGDGRITIISDEPYHTYSRPLISYWLAGKVTEEKMAYRTEKFYEANNVTALLGKKASKVDFAGKKVILDNGQEVSYDKLLLATGGKPIIPPVEGLNKKDVYSFLKFDDVKSIKDAVDAGAKKAVIIGAGLIGLKAAEALNKCGVEVNVVELADRILPAILDEQAAPMVQDYLEHYGIKFYLGNTVSRVQGTDTVTGVELKDGTKIPADMLVVGIGVQPNTDLVKDTDIALNRGILINEKMETSAKDVYAAGDVSEGYDLVYETKRVLPLLPNAYMQGEVAGRNMAGEAAEYAGGVAMNAIGFGELPMLTAGIIKPDSDEYEVMLSSDPSSKSYRKVVLKSGRIVGFICLNKVDRAGILTSLIKDKTDVTPFKDRLLCSDFGYVDFPADFRKARLNGGARQ